MKIVFLMVYIILSLSNFDDYIDNLDNQIDSKLKDINNKYDTNITSNITINDDRFKLNPDKSQTVENVIKILKQDQEDDGLMNLKVHNNILDNSIDSTGYLEK